MSAIDLLLARKEIALEFAHNFGGIEPREVVVAPAKRGRSVKYSGPEMMELWLSLRLPYNPQRSTLELVRSCAKCGRSEYKILGIEEPPHEEKVGDRWEMMPRRPRKAGMGVLILQSSLADCDFFNYADRFNMCTERAKNYIEERGWTNIEYVEYGEVVAD